MNFSRVEGLEASNRAPEYLMRDADEHFASSSRRTRRLDRLAARLERDRARGYSINVKQVVLAFTIEFFIIAIVLIGQYYLALESTVSANVVPALLFPLSLAVIELARVPLAISVRTAQSWNIQFAALLGVGCAVIVTSFSLYQIGHNTFNPRLEAVNAKRIALQDASSKRQEFGAWRVNAQSTIEKMRADRDRLAERYTAVTAAMNQQKAQDCSPTFQKRADGTEIRGQTCRPNPLLKTMLAEVADAKQKLQDADAALAQAEAQLGKQLAAHAAAPEQNVRKAEAEYRDAIFHSPLHAYTGMLFGKDPGEVSEGEVKTLQRYLIGVPSIAAALASTLIAMAAVRRIRRRDAEQGVALPDEAVAYLFGPLVTAIRTEANNAVTAALNSNTTNHAQGPPKDNATSGAKSGNQ